MASFKTAPSQFAGPIHLPFTKDEREAKAAKDVWWKKVQWRVFKGYVNPNDTREFYRLYAEMKRSGDETELTAWIKAYNSGSAK